jgi:hypothetical protein
VAARDASATRPACSGSALPGAEAAVVLAEKHGGALSHSTPAASSSVACAASSHASWPRYSSRPSATVDTPDASTGSPHWMASLATASVLRRPRVRAATRCTSSRW